MYNKYLLPMILSICLVLVTMYLYGMQVDDTRVFYSSTGCCSISEQTKHINDDDVLYIITYTDNTTGDVYVEQETTLVDSEYMINMFQDVCYDKHGTHTPN